MQDSVAQLGEALQVMLTFPSQLRAGSSLGMCFQWLVQSQSWKGHLFSVEEEILDLLMP